MMESLVLFDSVVNSRWFMRTSIILFLNKVDLFKAKLARSPLGNYFPDYSGGNDVNRAAKYLLWRFNQVNRAHLNLYPQYAGPPALCHAATANSFQPHTSDRHIQHPARLCRCQRNNIAKRVKRLGYFIVLPLTRPPVSHLLHPPIAVYTASLYYIIPPPLTTTAPVAPRPISAAQGRPTNQELGAITLPLLNYKSAASEFTRRYISGDSLGIV
jgi:hypothetical protein